MNTKCIYGYVNMPPHSLSDSQELTILQTKRLKAFTWLRHSSSEHITFFAPHYSGVSSYDNEEDEKFDEVCKNPKLAGFSTTAYNIRILQRRGERRATINEKLWGGVYVRGRFISQSEHTPKYVY